MDDFLFYLISGVCAGSIYALIAIGYTLVYGIIKLINFAHGEFYMVGAYVGFGAYFFLSDINPYLALVLMVGISGCAGALIALMAEYIAYKPIRNSGRLSALLTAIGVSFFLQNLANFVNSGKPLQFPSGVVGSIGELCQRSFIIGGGGIKVIKLLFIVIAGLLTLGLWYIVMKTRFGKAMRAVSLDSDAAKLMGINGDQIIRRTFVIGGFLAGVAGILVGLQGVIEPMMGFMPGLHAFIAAVVGGIGSIPGAVLGGFLIGLSQSLVVWVGVPTGYKDVASFLILISVLVIKPQGILGHMENEKV